MGWGMGRTGMGSRPLRDREPMEKAVGLRPTTRWGRKAPDPFSGHDGARHSLARPIVLFLSV